MQEIDILRVPESILDTSETAARMEDVFGLALGLYGEQEDASETLVIKLVERGATNGVEQGSSCEAATSSLTTFVMHKGEAS
jgi:hypothetical protein